MAKAVYTTPSGGAVTIEGTEAEVVAVLSKLGTLPRGSSKVAPRTGHPPAHAGRRGVVGYVVGLRDAGFFKTPRKVVEVAEALRKEGHLVPSSRIAVALLRLVRRKDLQRSREGHLWRYGNR